MIQPRIFRTILLPLRSKKSATSSIHSASILANRLSAELFISELNPHNLAQQLLGAIDRFSVDLVVIASSQYFGVHAQQLIHKSPVPVLLMPEQEEFSWGSILVPMSGEIRQNAALELAIALAPQLEAPVDVIHVTPSDLQATEWSQCMVEQYTDHPHHEYPGRIEEFLAEAAPFTGARERSRIREVRLVTGDPANEILVHSQALDTGLMILEWHGSIRRGHAATLRKLLRQLHFPVLLVRPHEHQYALKITLIAS